MCCQDTKDLACKIHGHKREGKLLRYSWRVNIRRIEERESSLVVRVETNSEDPGKPVNAEENS